MAFAGTGLFAEAYIVWSKDDFIRFKNSTNDTFDSDNPVLLTASGFP